MENGRSPGGAVMAWTASRRVAPTASLLTLEQNSGQLGGTPEWLLPGRSLVAVATLAVRSRLSPSAEQPRDAAE
jgi:hypothetical protein